MNHAPTPLQIKRESDDQGYKGIVLTTPDGSCIANMVMQLDDTELANARFIATACNAHEELVAELKRTLMNARTPHATDWEIVAERISSVLTTIEKGA